MSKFKKELLTLVVVIAIAIAFVACSGSQNKSESTTWRNNSVDYPVFTQTMFGGLVDEQVKVTLDFGSPLAQDVTVSLSGLDTTDFSYPSSVTAKKGDTSVSFYVTASSISYGTLSASGKYYQVNFNRETDIAGFDKLDYQPAYQEGTHECKCPGGYWVLAPNGMSCTEACKF